MVSPAKIKPSRWPNAIRVGPANETDLDPFVSQLSVKVPIQKGVSEYFSEAVSFPITPFYIAASITRSETVGSNKTFSLGTESDPTAYFSNVDASSEKIVVNKEPIIIARGERLVVNLGSNDWEDGVIEFTVFYGGSLLDLDVFDETPTPSSPVFGTQYQRFESLGNDSSLAPYLVFPATKIDVNTSSLPAGKYLITVCYRRSMNVTNRSFLSDFLVDDVKQGTVDESEMKDETDKRYVTRTFELNLSGIHNLKLNYGPEQAMRIATMSDASITVWRVS